MTIRKHAPQHAPIAYGVLADSIGYRLHLADLVNMQGIARALAGTGMTAARFTALELIGSNPGIKPARLATAMMVERSNLVGLVRYLAEQGWVQATEGTNRREKSLELTEAGRQALHALHRRLSRHEAKLTATLSAAEQASLSRLLARIAGL
jgi:DNA-binding MarR family transcriptional regulator